jgi:hypothetical protein
LDEAHAPDTNEEPTVRRLSVLLSAAGALVVAGAMSAPATATAGATTPSVPFQARIGKILGMIPPVNLSTGHPLTNNAPASGSLDYNGGPVMLTNKVYTIFWAPSGGTTDPTGAPFSFPAGYQAGMNTYFSDLQAQNGSNTNAYDVATQYYQQAPGSSTKQYVQNHTTFGGTTLDTDPLPPLDPVNCPDTPATFENGTGGAPSTQGGCVTDQQVQQEISTVVKREGWPVSNDTEFFMFTAPNIGTCFPATVTESQGGVQTTVTVPLCSFSYFCAYHSSYFDTTISSSSGIIYSNMPFAMETAGNPLTCDEQEYPNGSASGIDPEINVTSHEHNESITDPFGNAWWDSNPNDSAAGDEIGDMCAWDFGNAYGAAGAQYSQTINRHHYLMQTEWDNATNGCDGSDSSGNPVPSHPNYAVPAISLTPNQGYPTAPFKITGLFFAAGDKVTSTFSWPGATPRTLGTVVANSSGQIYESPSVTKVPAGAAPGADTVTSTGHSGRATATFTVDAP